MKNIQKVILFRIEGFVCYLSYFGKCLSNEMSGPKGKNIIRINDNCGFITLWTEPEVGLYCWPN